MEFKDVTIVHAVDGVLTGLLLIFLHIPRPPTQIPSEEEWV